jgi:hypothetical protein
MLRSLLLATLVVALLAPLPSGAQGTDHYEVTIAPPTRPGKQPAAPPPTLPASSAPEAAAAPEAKAAAPSDLSQQPTAQQATAEPAASAAAQPTGPLRSLQVGAYRQRRSAEQMSEKLGDAFGEVQVIEVDSGGEKLYRVRVGRMPAGPALSELKSRLLAAGYPAFEVEISGPR